jgi:prepilin-type N-terminal cleavage/methylation domain-containing protein
MNKEKGFSLIELIIATSILAVLTYFTSNTIRNSMRNRKQLRETIAIQTELRDSLRIIEQDINRAFHYQDLNDRLDREAKKAAAKVSEKKTSPPGKSPAGDGEQSQQPAPAPDLETTPNPEDPPRPQITFFIGATNEIHFTSLGHVRKYLDSPESDQEEVGYVVKSCLSQKKVNGQRVSFPCLWRRTSPYIDDDITKGGTEMVLLENVEEFKLAYIGGGNEEWVDEWRSDDTGAPEHRDKFPEAVKIYLKIKKGIGNKAKTAESMTVASIHFPNNIEKAPIAGDPQP